MPQIVSQIPYSKALRLGIIVFMVHAFLAVQAWGLTPQQQFFRAQNAATALKKNPRHLKYRDKWLACIEKYQQVYRLAPSGPWAAAGLYNAGLLYLELAKRSYLASDRQEAADLFQRVIQRFPKSRYAPKSRAQLEKLKKAPAIPQSSAARVQFRKAQTAYQRLMDNIAKQKYRDQWERCIDLFQ